MPNYNVFFTVRKCEWETCAQPRKDDDCVQVNVATRKPGVSVEFQECREVLDEPCSAVEVEKQRPLNCLKGDCYRMAGIFDCVNDTCLRWNEAFECRERTVKRLPVKCWRSEGNCYETIKSKSGRNDESFDRDVVMTGLFRCTSSDCEEIVKIDKFQDHLCTRKCTSLNMQNMNTVVFSSDRLVATTCRDVSSSSGADGNKLSDISNNNDWKSGVTVALVFCSNVTITSGNSGTYNLSLTDCINGTLAPTKDVQKQFDYRYLLKYFNDKIERDLPENVIAPIEKSLQIEASSKLVAIDVEDCFCKDFYREFGKTGADGRARSIFPCR